jgi:hypothetical protein
MIALNLAINHHLGNVGVQDMIMMHSIAELCALLSRNVQGSLMLFLKYGFSETLISVFSQILLMI